MFAEQIPKEWRDPVTKKVFDLTKKDLPKAAVFQSDYATHKLFLSPTQSQYNTGTEKHERLPGSGVRVMCTGGSLVVHNKRLLALVMANSAYHRGILRIDYSDPTGFWRDVGMVTPKQVHVAVFDAVAGILQYEDLAGRLKDVRVEKDEGGEPVEVKPLLNFADVV